MKRAVFQAKRSVALLFAAAAAWGTAGCSSLPEPLRPGDVPDTFAAPLPGDLQDLPVSNWWEHFSSDELSAFVTEAKGGNLDLAVYGARIHQAQAQTGAAVGDMLPSIGLQASATRSASKYGSKWYINNSYKPTASFSYALDPWGVARDAWRSQRYSTLSSIYKREAAWLSVSANVADTYLSVLAYRDRIVIAKRNVDAARRILDITRARVKRGAESNLGLAQQMAILKSEELTIPSLEEQEREAVNALAILVGKAPGTVNVEATTLTALSAPPVSPGLPSELLRRRPDIAMAEANLKAGHANLNAAIASFLPTISLTGDGGTSHSDLAKLLDPGNLSWALTATLVQAIFDGGKLTSKRDYYKGVEEELVASYRSTVFNALSDVEKALGNIESLNRQMQIVTERVDNAVEAFRISELQYRQGVVGLLTVLDTQQTMFNAEDEMVRIRLARLEAVISLYLALGGGWSFAADKDVPTRNAFVPVPLPIAIDRKP